MAHSSVSAFKCIPCQFVYLGFLFIYLFISYECSYAVPSNHYIYLCLVLTHTFLKSAPQDICLPRIRGPRLYYCFECVCIELCLYWPILPCFLLGEMTVFGASLLLLTTMPSHYLINPGARTFLTLHALASNYSKSLTSCK